MTGDNERKGKNLRGNPQVVLTTGVNTLTSIDYVLEGTATQVTSSSELDAAADTFESTLAGTSPTPMATGTAWVTPSGTGPLTSTKSSPPRAFAFGNGKFFSETRYIWTEDLSD